MLASILPGHLGTGISSLQPGQIRRASPSPRGHDLQVTDRDRCPDAGVFAGGVRRALDELAQQLT